jgi:hypothetical protein
MSRRYFVMTAGIFLGAMVAVLGLYLSRSPAADQTPIISAGDKSVTISERDLKKLVDRISDLESRVKALEYNGIVLLGPPAKNSIQPQMIVPETWPNDGFGPVKTISADSRNR